MNYSIKTSYFIAICAFALSLSTYFIYESFTVQGLYYSSSVLLGTQVIYSALRLDTEIKQTKRFQKFLSYSILPILVSAFFLYLAELTILQYSLIGFSGLLTLIYSSHIWQQTKKLSFRNSAVLKLLCIGIVWGITCTIIPLTTIADGFSIKNYLHICVIILMIIWLTIPFEMNDKNPLNSSRSKTLPELIGKEWTLKISRMLAIATWFGAGFVSVPTFFAMGVIILVYLKFLNEQVENLSLKNLTLRFDGLIILFAILASVFTFLMS